MGRLGRRQEIFLFLRSNLFGLYNVFGSPSVKAFLWCGGGIWGMDCFHGDPCSTRPGSYPLPRNLVFSPFFIDCIIRCNKHCTMYKVLAHREYYIGDYTVRSVQEEDILDIKRWRNEQISLLRQRKPITNEEQREYFARHVFPDFLALQPRQILLSLLRNGKLVGYGGFVHIDWEYQRAEQSFLVETSRMENQLMADDFRAMIAILQKIAFEEFGWNKLSSEAYDIPERQSLFPLLNEAGYVLEGRLRDWVIVEGHFVDSVLHGKLRKEYIPSIGISTSSD